MKRFHQQMALPDDNSHNYLLPPPSNILGYSSTSHSGNGPTPSGLFSPYSVDTEESPSSDGHSYMHNGFQGLSSIPPPPLPAFMTSSYPSLFHIDSQLSPRNLYRSEPNPYSSHHHHQHHLHQQQNSRTGSGLPTWSTGRDLMSLPPTASSGASSSSYPAMIYPPQPSWQSSYENTMNIRPMQMPKPPKAKRPRMSLQKRLLVNARERERMRVLNKAFESLRDALPCYIADGHMAKITTLRLAINYIKALGDLLNEQNMFASKLGSIGNGNEKSHEELFSNILRDSKVDGVKPILKNLDERLAISKSHHNNKEMFDRFAFMQDYQS